MQQEFDQPTDLANQDLQQIEKWLDRLPTPTEQLFFKGIHKLDLQLNDLNLLPTKQKKIYEHQGHFFLELGNQQLCSLQVRARTAPTAMAKYASAEVMADTHRAQAVLGAQSLAAWQALGLGDIQRFNTQLTTKNTIDGLGQVNHQMGIPSLGGTLSFHPSFNQNVLVNAFTIGVLDKKNLAQRPRLDPNATLVLMSPYPEVEENTASSFLLPNPLAEQQLVEAVQEIFALGFIPEMHTLDKGGLVGALLRCCLENQLGVTLDLSPFEQEAPLHNFLQAALPASILLLVNNGDQSYLRDITEKRGLHLKTLGQVQTDFNLQLKLGTVTLADLPIHHLKSFQHLPSWLRNTKKPGQGNRTARFNFKKSASSKSYLKTAKRVLKDPNTFDQKWLKEQLDATVQMNNLNLDKPNAASVIRTKVNNKLLAFSCDVNPRFTEVDPYYGTVLAVAEAARNIIISGATPVATVACLNFGNPEEKIVSWQIQQALKAIQDATHKFQTPLLDLDWSLGNQSITKQGPRSIVPMPVIGMLGILPETPSFTGIGFKEDGHLIYMIGTPHNDINASVYLKLLQSDASSPTPVFDLDEEYHIQLHLQKLIHREMIASAHDVVEGGLLVALLECAAVYGYGFSIETDTNFRKDAYLFGEHQSRVIVSLKPEREDDLVNYLNAQNVPFTRLGEVSGDQVLIDDDNFGPLEEWVAIRTQGMENAMK